MPSNLPPGFKEDKYIPQDTQCPKCHLIIEVQFDDHSVPFCPECGEKIEAPEPPEYEPDMDL